MNEKKIYIDSADWIRRLEEEYESCKDEKRKVYIKIQINSIMCQPKLSKEDILNK